MILKAARLQAGSPMRMNPLPKRRQPQGKSGHKGKAAVAPCNARMNFRAQTGDNATFTRPLREPVFSGADIEPP